MIVISCLEARTRVFWEKRIEKTKPPALWAGQWFLYDYGNTLRNRPKSASLRKKNGTCLGFRSFRKEARIRKRK